MKEESRIIAGIKDWYRYLVRAVVIGGSLLIIGSVMLWCSGWRINLEYSMPRGVYRSSSGEYRSGDLALVRLPGRWSDYVLRRGYAPSDALHDRTRDALKYVCAIPGNQVRIGVDGIEVDDWLLPFTAPKERDSSGRKLPVMTLTAVLQPGEYLVCSNQDALGFDSRYYGIVNRSNLIGRMRIVVAID